MEEAFLDEYYLLVKRIEGISLSLDDFLNYDSFYMNYLLNKEKELIEYEQREYEDLKLRSENTNEHGTRRGLVVEDSPDAIMAYEAYFD